MTELPEPSTAYPARSGPVPTLSVLDLAPVVNGSTPAQALRNSLDLAQCVERLGYHRYWVAEHHNMPGIASSSPAVLLAHVASVTESIRIGSGGVMLPNHAPLAVVEQFGMLEALHPGRVDLGIGRAPGTDPLTAHALRRGNGLHGGDDFPDQLDQLFGFFGGDFAPDHPYRSIHASPGRGYRPDIWLLGSSDYSARAAAELGLPFSFAYHFAVDGLELALDAYRSNFRPSPYLAEPYVMLGVNAVAAESESHARYLAAPGALAILRLRQGNPGYYPTADEAAEYSFTPSEREFVKGWTASHIVGTPDAVRAGFVDLAARTGSDELMITTMVPDHAERLRSYELIAKA